MRQIGVLCAAACIALRDNVNKLKDDHRRAKILAGFDFFFHVLTMVLPLQIQMQNHDNARV